MSRLDHLSERVSHLPPARRALLEKLTRGEFQTESRAIPRRADQGPAPLSFSQQRLWFFNQFEPNSSAYNIPGVVRLTGTLNVEALEQSLSEVVRRHEALRTSFVTVNGQSVQVIAPFHPLSLPLIDLQALPSAEREAEAQRLANEELQSPFVLVNGPLLRVKLVQLAEEEHVLLMTMHHIISDGWSMGILIRELATLYPAFLHGQPSPLPELPIQYADYAVWQRQWLQGEMLETQLHYWKDRLAGGTATLELPTDHPRPAVQTFHGTRHMLTFSPDLSEQLKVLSRNEGVTLFMTLLAAFTVLLSRYTGQEDIIVGTPIANRTRREIEEVIGFFVNTLVLRTDLSGDPSFRELLGRVREVALGGYAHQELPFEKLVEVLQFERDLSHQALFQVVFILQNAPMPALQLPGLTLSLPEIDNKTAKFDLTLTMVEMEQRLAAAFEYNTDLFEASTIERMANHFQKLLEGIVADPGQRLSDLPLLTETECHQLLVEWNDTRVDYPADMLEGQLFEAQVIRTPDAPAVTFQDESLTYRELNERANQLAHHLQALGVGPDVLVGIYMEPSLEMMVGLLGILKAGGAYVPLDPIYPHEWLSFIVSDTHAPVLLTQARLTGSLPEHSGQVLCLDTDWGKIAQASKENPTSKVTADNLAYVAYTSGSTGLPKGVMNTRRGHVNYLLWCAKAYRVEEGTGALVHSSLAFDFTNTTIFPPLLVGRCVILLPRANAVETLVPALRSHAGLSLIKITPAHLDLLNQQLSPEEMAGRTRTLVVAADQLIAESLAPWQEFAPDTLLFNEYGPTETVDGCSAYPISPDEQLSGPVPIGYPIANMQFYLLDAYRRLVPVGVPGELYIGGAGIAHGYLNRPDLTAESFVPHPFSKEPGARLYKTGDRVRYLPDGNVEFLGRIDHQVKIRGYRVELDEIEAVLVYHPAVQETVVVVREYVPGDKRLVAYIVPRQQDQTPTSGELRTFLKQQLPDYMVPSFFVILEALPLTSNGKIDHKALPQPDSARPEVGTVYVAPQSELERKIAAVWQEALHLEKVGIHDNFFDLGGHSLLMLEVQRQLQEALAREVSLVEMFQYPTIDALAGYLNRQKGEEQPSLQARQRAETRKASMSRLEQRRRAVKQKEEV